MTQFQYFLAILAGGLCVITFALPFGVAGDTLLTAWSFWPLGAFLVLTFLVLVLGRSRLHPALPGLLAVAGGIVLLVGLGWLTAAAATGFWVLLLLCWVLAWLFAERLTADVRAGRVEAAVSAMLVDPPDARRGRSRRLGGRDARRRDPLRHHAAALRHLGAPHRQYPDARRRLPADLPQSGTRRLRAQAAERHGVRLIAILIDRSPFLKRGLLPLGNFVSALPMVGIAPITVLWFGFDWPSKAAVVVIMTFFPMLVNTVAGLNASGSLERDMMRTYAASYWQTLFKLRLPAAAPFIFNALKINSTLALIGAIVAEFFGTPVVGMGFRISTAVGRMDIDLVWAEIAVCGGRGVPAFYAVIAFIERGVTFWHPSVRGGRA